ncbi:hypothetical protein B0H13DRAFT_1890234 [Mycena leptocephala]|nr:hypothetical protein B0H13DRAFT_1890234 [Mycena leptocephala]
MTVDIVGDDEREGAASSLLSRTRLTEELGKKAEQAVAVHAQPLITDRWCLRACRQLDELLRLDRVDSNGLGSKDSPPWQWPIYNVVTDSLVSSPPWDVALEDINLALLLHVFRQTRLFRSTARDVVLVWSDLGTYEFTAAMRPPGISVAIFAIVSCISVQDRETARGPGSRYRPQFVVIRHIRLRGPVSVPWGHSSTPALTRQSPHAHLAPTSPPPSRPFHCLAHSLLDLCCAATPPPLLDSLDSLPPPTSPSPLLTAYVPRIRRRHFASWSMTTLALLADDARSQTVGMGMRTRTQRRPRRTGGTLNECAGRKQKGGTFHSGNVPGLAELLAPTILDQAETHVPHSASFPLPTTTPHSKPPLTRSRRVLCGAVIKNVLTSSDNIARAVWRTSVVDICILCCIFLLSYSIGDNPFHSRVHLCIPYHAHITGVLDPELNSTGFTRLLVFIFRSQYLRLHHCGINSAGSGT